jgi:hypothetical protein
MCENPGFAAAHARGVFGIEAPDPFAFRELSFNTTFGFFATSPFMTLGLAGLLLTALASDRRWRPFVGAAFAVMLSLWLAVSGFVSWRGGWTVGPRFFGAAPPFFGAFALVGLERVASLGAWPRAVARGLATGLALASVAILGVLGTLTGTLPEAVGRPLVDLVIPFLVAGIVPHHAFELVGVAGIAGYFAVLAVLVAASAVPVMAPSGDSFGRLAARVAIAAIAFAAALRPQFVPIPKDEAFADATSAREFFLGVWEPAGRDRWTELRGKHANGTATACDYTRLARIERLMGHPEAAKAHDGRVGSLGGCPNRLLGF